MEGNSWNYSGIITEKIQTHVMPKKYREAIHNEYWRDYGYGSIIKTDVRNI